MPIDKHIINANLEAEGVINAQLDKSGYTEDETSVMAGKAAIAASITNKGVLADKTDSFHQLSEKVSRITTGEGGASALNDLTDVEISTPTSGQILKYDEENDKWVNGEEFLAPAIYSTDEREIGVWIDGKPLYQKTWIFSDVITLQTNTWTNTPIKCSDYNFEKIVNAHIILSSTGTMYNYIAIAVDDEYVRANSARPSIVEFDIITIQYTKTTDTPGSGIWTPSGIQAVHYDGNEKVIGTWFGQTLYEKTFDLGEDTPIYATTWFITTISWQDFNIDRFVYADGCTSGGTYAGIFLCSKNSSGYIEIQTPRNYDYTSLRYFTVRYTKTT